MDRGNFTLPLALGMKVLPWCSKAMLQTMMFLITTDRHTSVNIMDILTKALQILPPKKLLKKMPLSFEVGKSQVYGTRMIMCR